jgi:hypothetical protein
LAEQYHPLPQHPQPPLQQPAAGFVGVPAPLGPNVAVVAPAPQLNVLPANVEDDDIIVLD